MTEHRNLILAVVLSALILIGWTFITDRYFPVANEPTTAVVKDKQVPAPGPGGPADDGGPAVMRSLPAALAESPRVKIDTPRLQGSINLRGARIDDLVLIDHRQTMEQNAPPVRLLSPSGTADAQFAGFGWTGEGTALPTADTVWTASGTRLAPDSPVTLSWDNGQGQRFEIRLGVDENYMFTVEQRVANSGTGAVAVRPYALISRTGISKDADSWTVHTGPIGVFGGSATYDVDFSDLDEDGPRRFTTTGGWLGFGDKYWLTALIPDQGQAVEASFRHGGSGRYQADFAAAPTILPPGRAVSKTSRFFAGAKEVALLDRYEDDLGIAQFDKAIDWGWFYWFEKPIFYLLDWLFRMIGNFGLAIMGLTLIVRLLMFPIAQKQFASFAAMRVLQPKMKALQERYKDDKARLQQEMLNLYKEEKVNPMAGCLPILIQIPIFYALYKVLLLSIEMRHQPFVLWIKDLSAPDPLTPINLFGLLPITLPSFLVIGILPILVGVTMWLQFKLNPQPMDPVQKQMFSIMPWVLTVIMAPFAAGLQLYWATSNILTILQQKWLYSRHPAMKAAPEAK